MSFSEKIVFYKKRNKLKETITFRKVSFKAAKPPLNQTKIKLLLNEFCKLKQAVMRFKTLLLILTIIATMGNLSQAQDIHFTQFDMSPSTLNPALTGAYEGTFRLGIIYRDQWASVIGNPYRTPSAYLDAPIVRGFSEKHWVGVGVSFLNDQSGEYKLTNQLAGASLAYHIGLGNEGKTTVSIGGQVNNLQRRVDATQLRPADSWDPVTGWTGTSSDPSINSIANVSIMDVNAGISLMTATGADDKIRIRAGVSAFHLNGAEDALSGGTEKMPLRTVAHANVDVDLNEKLVLSPGLFFQTMGGAQEVNLVAMLGYRLKENFMIQYGQGYRFGDATNCILAVQYDKLRAGVSYDINISDLSSISSNQGGFELALSYIASIYKEPKSDPIIFCPRF